MGAAVSDLTEFLLARIAEDEAVARVNTDQPENPQWDTWSVERRDDRAVLLRQVAPGSGFTKSDYLVVSYWDIRFLDQLARWDPARVLDECETKRQIVGLHSKATRSIYTPTCLRCRDLWPCTELRLLAVPYRDHPDYRSEWAPTSPGGQQ